AFALVAGLLLIGAVAAREGVFAEAGALVARAPGGPFVLLAGLLVVEEHVSGTTFASRLAPAWCVSVAITIVFVSFFFRRDLSRPTERIAERVPFRPGVGVVAVAVAAVLVLALARPALPVLGLGLATALVGRLGVRRAVEATNP